MPAGIIATVDGDYATVDFVDPTKRGPALAALAALGAPIETITRDGPRRKYRVLLNFAEQVELVDGTEDGAVFSAGHDTGAAAAVVAADPNVNPGADNADWHTPVDQYTSANKYVGQVPNADVLHGRPQVSLAGANGYGSSFGGSGDAPLHRDVIAYTKLHGGTLQAPQQPGGYGHPGAEANGNLGLVDGALATDPGGLPDVGGSFVAENFSTVQAMRVAGETPLAGPEDVTETDGAGEPVSTPPSGDSGAQTPAPVTEAEGAPRPEGLPEGEPSDAWSRPQLNAYADWKGLDGESYANKAEVLTAIQAPKTGA